MKSQLSICIPTFNRSKKLKACIDSFIQEAMDANVHIIVSDNGSDDDTNKIVESYVHYEHFYYFRHDTNQGPDLNMLFAINSSKTEYNWWLGDDDVLEPNSINSILALLKLGYDLILLNSFVKKSTHADLTKRINITKNQVYTSHLDFYREYHFHMTFGCLIVRKLPEEFCNKFDAQIGSMHAYVIYTLMSIAQLYKKNKVANILVCSEPLMTWDGGEKEYFNGIYELYYFKMLSMRKTIPDEYAAIKESVVSDYLEKVTSIKFLCLVKRMSPFELLPFKKGLQLSKSFSLKQKINFFVISCLIPRFIMRYAINAYKRFKELSFVKA